MNILLYHLILGPVVPSFSRVLKAFNTFFSELFRSEEHVSKSLYGYLGYQVKRAAEKGLDPTAKPVLALS